MAYFTPGCHLHDWDIKYSNGVLSIAPQAHNLVVVLPHANMLQNDYSFGFKQPLFYQCLGAGDSVRLSLKRGLAKNLQRRTPQPQLRLREPDEVAWRSRRR